MKQVARSARSFSLLRDRGRLVILLIEQHYDHSRDLADRFAVMEPGGIVLAGTREQMIEDDVRCYLVY